MTKMTIQLWRRVPGKTLFFLLNLFSATALVFEGYNQGVFGTVSGTPGFIAMAGIGYGNTVTNSTKQGGLAASYYLGAIVGCLLGGMYFFLFFSFFLRMAGWAIGERFFLFLFELTDPFFFVQAG